jgi:hypothetical protein
VGMQCAVTIVVASAPIIKFLFGGEIWNWRIPSGIKSFLCWNDDPIDGIYQCNSAKHKLLSIAESVYSLFLHLSFCIFPLYWTFSAAITWSLNFYWALVVSQMHIIRIIKELFGRLVSNHVLSIVFYKRRPCNPSVYKTLIYLLRIDISKLDQEIPSSAIRRHHQFTICCTTSSNSLRI